MRRLGAVALHSSAVPLQAAAGVPRIDSWELLRPLTRRPPQPQQKCVPTKYREWTSRPQQYLALQLPHKQQAA